MHVNQKKNKVLDSRNVIDRLSLSDNFIHIDGGRALARALKTSMLRVLDLKVRFFFFFLL